MMVDGSSCATSSRTRSRPRGRRKRQRLRNPRGFCPQLKDLPWSNVNQIQIVFNENVNIQANSLVVTSSSLVPYTFANFTYSSATHTAIWTLNQPIAPVNSRSICSRPAQCRYGHGGQPSGRRLDRRRQYLSLGRWSRGRGLRFCVQCPAGRRQPRRNHQRKDRAHFLELVRQQYRGRHQWRRHSQRTRPGRDRRELVGNNTGQRRGLRCPCLRECNDRTESGRRQCVDCR